MKYLAGLFAGLLLSAAVFAQEDSRIVVGPENMELHDGAIALSAGDADEGIRLTLAGLSMATSRQERLTAFANLCAGYILKDSLEAALDYCDRALSMNDRHWRSYSNRALILIRLERYDEARRDLDSALAIRPEADKVKTVQAMLRDATDPVMPNVVIDDRRADAEEETDEDDTDF